MRYAKRLLCLLCCCLLVVTPAFAATGDTTFTSDTMLSLFQNPMAITALEDTVYLAGYQKLYSVRAGDTSPTEMTFTGYIAETMVDNTVEIPVLYTRDGLLYAVVLESRYDTETVGFAKASLCQLTVVGKTAFSQYLRELNWELLTQKDAYGLGTKLLSGYAYTEGLLYVLADGSITEINCENSTSKSIAIDNVQGLCTYVEGAVLFEQASNEKLTFTLFDTATGKTSRLAEVASPVLCGLAYDAANDYLYYAGNGVLHRVSGMDFANVQEVSDLPVTPAAGVNGVLLGGLYAVGTYDAFAMRNTDESQRGAYHLTVAAGNTSLPVLQNAYEDFRKSNDIAVYVTQADEDAAVDFDNTEADLLILWVDSKAYQSIAGQRAVISSQGLLSKVQRMYPVFGQLCLDNGQLVSYPVALGGSCLALRRDGMAAFGITSVPESFTEFLALLGTLGEKVNGEYCVFDPYVGQADVRNMLITATLQLYNGNVSGLKSALESINSLNLSALGVPEKAEVAAYRQSLVTAFGGFLPADYDTATQPLALSFDGAGVYGLRVQVAVVNPSSPYQSEATALLEAMASQMDGDTAMALSDENNAPVRSDNYEADKAYWENEIAGLQTELQTAQGDVAQGLRAVIEEYQQYLNDVENSAWRISADSIAFYQQNVKCLQVITSPYAFNPDSETLINQLSEKQISVDAFLDALQKQ